jgi:N-dimethylarginine dimethylaminohydrolase
MKNCNEWGNLEKVVVGTATGAKLPALDKSVRTVNYADKTDVSNIRTDVYPQQVIDEANEDLEIFCDFLRKEGAEVVRPVDNNPAYYNYCPRDSVLICGGNSYGAPMPIKCRQQEYKAFETHLNNLNVIPCYTKNNLYNLDCVGDPDTLALNEHAPAFDAANIIRANEHLLYLVSNSGNKKGAEYLQKILGNKVRVHTLENVYSYMHIDSTIAFLREGLLLANPDRIKNKYQLPKPFCDWDVIWAPEPADIGHFPGICNASKWINMNLFSVREDLVVLEQHQNTLRILLEQKGIQCAMLPMRHQRTLGGGFHCVTLDLVRDKE